MTPLGFAWAHIGDVLHAEGGLGGECVDLVNVYLAEAFGYAPIQRNAVDWRNVAIPKFRWEANTPFNSPLAGSLVVWGQNAEWGIGPNGHIALCLSADRMYLSTFDQNWPSHAYSRQHLHNYGGVLGWHRPGG
jgi:hypothetical protein